MLIELWERIRGYDKWPQTEATIRSSNLAHVLIGYNRGTPVMEWQNTCVIEWRDLKEEGQSDDFCVAESSPLFQLYEGQKVTIHCNPADPSQYFFPELQRTKAIRAVQGVLVVAVIVGFFVLVFWLFPTRRVHH